MREELRAAGPLVGDAKDFIKDTSPARRDQIWTEATRLVLEAQAEPDAAAPVECRRHRTITRAADTRRLHGLLADACVGRVLDAIAAAGIQDKTAVFIVADHGFTLTPKALKPNALLRREGFLKAGRGGKIEEARVQVVPEGGMGLLYFSDPGLSAEEQGAGPAVVRGAGRDRPGARTAAVLAVRPAESAGRRSDGRSGLAGQRRIRLFGRADGDDRRRRRAAGVPKGSHGFIAEHKKMNAVFVAAVAGLKQGYATGRDRKSGCRPDGGGIAGPGNAREDGRGADEALAIRRLIEPQQANARGATSGSPGMRGIVRIDCALVTSESIKQIAASLAFAVCHRLCRV